MTLPTVGINENGDAEASATETSVVPLIGAGGLAESVAVNVAYMPPL